VLPPPLLSVWHPFLWRVLDTEDSGPFGFDVLGSSDITDLQLDTLAKEVKHCSKTYRIDLTACHSQKYPIGQSDPGVSCRFWLVYDPPLNIQASLTVSGLVLLIGQQGINPLVGQKADSASRRIKLGPSKPPHRLKASRTLTNSLARQSVMFPLTPLITISMVPIARTILTRNLRRTSLMAKSSIPMLKLPSRVPYTTG